MNHNRIFRIACTGLLCGFVVCGCGCGSSYAPGMDKKSREAAMRKVRRLDALSAYYAGEDVAGLPLTSVSSGQWRRGGPWRSPGPTFGYGRCRLPSGLFAEGGCHLPLEIENWSRCSRWPGQYPRGHRPHVFDFHGAKAAWTGGGLEIFTGRTTVVVFGSRRAIEAVARQLRDVRQADPPRRLPRSAPGSLWGNGPCQRKRRLNRMQRQGGRR